MANRRMIARDVICSNSFIALPHSAQALFFQLTIDADDGGFVGSTERVLRTIGCTQDDMSALIEKGFVIRFDNDVIVMRHWKVANTVKNDRQVTNFQSELAQLRIDANKIYNLIPNVSNMEASGSEMIPNRTEGNPIEPNQNKPNPGEHNRGDEREREGGVDPATLFTEAQIESLKELYDPDRLDGAIRIYAKQASQYARHYEAFQVFVDKHIPTLRKKGEA